MTCSPQRFRACLLGASFATGNRGVSALSASLVQLIIEAQPDAEITVLSAQAQPENLEVWAGGRHHTVRIVNYRLTPRAPLQQQFLWILLLSGLHRIAPTASIRRRLARANPWVAALAGADFAGDIRGGDSFSDIYGLKRFLTGSLAAISALWVSRRLALLPQTYGPFSSRLSRIVARYILKRANPIFSRDPGDAGARTALRLTGGKSEPRFSPDVAFALEPRPAAHTTWDPVLPPDDPSPLVGLNVNGLMYRGGYDRANMFGLRLDYPCFLQLLCETLVTQLGARVLLVPHTYAPPASVESDPHASDELAASLPPAIAARIHCLRSVHDQHELKAAIGRCDFFIGSRMHACIAALSQGVPAIGVAYSQKFQGVFESAGVPDCVIDGRTASATDAVGRVREIFERRSALRPILRASADRNRETLRREFAELLTSRQPPPA